MNADKWDTKVISKSKAAQTVDAEQMIADECASWVSDYGYADAKIEAAAERFCTKAGRVSKSRTRFILILNSEFVEIEFSFYEYSDGNIEFEPTHWH